MNESKSNETDVITFWTKLGITFNSLMYLFYFPASLMLIYNWYLPVLFDLPKLGFVPFFVGLVVYNTVHRPKRNYYTEYMDETYSKKLSSHTKMALLQNHQTRRIFQVAFMLLVGYVCHFFI